MHPFSKKSTRLWIAFIFVLTALFFGSNAPQNAALHSFQKGVTKKQTTPHVEAGVFYPVIRVVDGDTVDVEINEQSERVRLIGLNTPETVDPRRPVECFGIEASNKAKSILSGQKVKIEMDVTQGTRDKYGRLLAYVFLPDGTLFNKMMIEDGYGHEYTYHTPYKYQKEFKAAEVQARESKKGLWADGACEQTS